MSTSDLLGVVIDETKYTLQDVGVPPFRENFNTVRPL